MHAPDDYKELKLKLDGKRLQARLSRSPPDKRSRSVLQKQDTRLTTC